jgi:phosphatidylglycerol lysyltransferase-like protein
MTVVLVTTVAIGLFSDSGKAFIMYRVKGKSWIALGDPVGPTVERERLVLTFRELRDCYGGWSVFYLLDAEGLSLYVDLGLTLLKVGEDARVPLERFSLTGHGRSELRKAHDRVLAEGVEFAIVSSHEVPALMPELEGCRTIGWCTWRGRSGASRGGSSARTTWPGSRARWCARTSASSPLPSFGSVEEKRS